MVKDKQIKKNSLRIVFFASACSLLPGSIIYAAQNNALTHPSYEILLEKYLKHPVVTLSGGPGWTSVGKTQTIYFQQDQNLQNTYYNQSATQSIVSGEFFVGIETPLLKHIKSQWGGLISGAGLVRSSGQIWQFSDPEFNNMNYSYSMNQLRLGIRSKWMTENYFTMAQIQPYLTGSIGVAFNHSYDFKNTATSLFTVPNPDFKDNTLAAFSYSVGAGLQKRINQQLHVGLGYEMLDWGKSGLGVAYGQTSGHGLGLNHLYTNNLILSLTYQA